MDRVTVYPGAIPLETDILNTNRNTMIGLGKLAAAVLGTSTQVNGFTVAPTSPAALNVVVAPGEIYSQQNIDNTAYSSLAALTTAQTVKQGILLTATTLAITPPATAGQSVNYLIQVAFAEADTGSVVLPYYNASNPSVAFSGAGNNGVAQPTSRACQAVVTAVAGAAAATGTQPTPAPAAGAVGVAVVTVAQGAATITSANITQLVSPISASFAKFDANGNFGLGVMPSAWGGPLLGTALEGRTGGSIAFHNSVATTYNTSNAYFNGSSWVYKVAGPAVQYELRGNTGTHAWNIAPSGTAGTAFTFLQAMTLDLSANLAIGTTNTTSANQGGIQLQTNSGTGFSNINVNHPNATGTGTPYLQFAYNASVVGSITQNGTTGIALNSTAQLALTGTTVTAPTPATSDSSTSVATTAFVQNAAVRAWVGFTGSTGAIRGSNNVASVTRRSAGLYTINMSTAAPTTNYTVYGGGGNDGTGTCYLSVDPAITRTTTAVGVQQTRLSVSPNVSDGDSVNGTYIMIVGQ